MTDNIHRKKEEINLFFTACFICCLDLFITTINQDIGFWIGAKSMVNESNKIVRYAMTEIPYGIFLITIVYLALLFILIIKLPILISRIICAASVLGNASGFISWIWYDIPQFFSITVFIIISSVIILLNFETKLHKMIKHIIIVFSALLFITSNVYAVYQKNFSELSILLKQNDFYEDIQNREVFNNSIFIEPVFLELHSNEITNDSWPLIKTDFKSIVFYSPIDIRKFIEETIFEYHADSDIETLNDFIQNELIEKSEGEYEIGKIIYYDHSKEDDMFSFNLLDDINGLEIDYEYSDLYYNIQLIYQEEKEKYVPVRYFYDFNLYVNKNDLSHSRYNLHLADNDLFFLSRIIEGE